MSATTTTTTTIKTEDVAVKRISRDVLNMNFMKRTTVKIERQQRIQHQQIVNEAIQSGKLAYGPPPYYPTVEHIDDDPNITLGGIQTEWRYSVLEEQKFGRFSFNGQNPEIEKLMIFHERRRLGLADPDEEKNAEKEDSDESDGREDGELTDSDDEGNHETMGRKNYGKVKEEEDEEGGNEPPAKKFRPATMKRPADEEKIPSRKNNKKKKRLPMNRRRRQRNSAPVMRK